jgi:hypothetical protein
MSAQYRSHRLARVFTAAVTAAALAAPAADARLLDGPNEPVRPDPGVPVELEQAPVVQTIDDGFDWGSAAIGAGGAGAVIVLVSLGGAAYVARHRAPVLR